MEALNWTTSGTGGGVYMTNGSGVISVTVNPILGNLTLNGSLTVAATSFLTGNIGIGAGPNNSFHLFIAGGLFGNSAADIVTNGLLTATNTTQTFYGTYLSTNINTATFANQTFNQLYINTPIVSGTGSIIGGWMLTIQPPAAGMSGALNVVGGQSTFGDAILFTGSASAVAGSVSYFGNAGLTLWANTGSIYDACLVNTLDTAYVWAVPTGTANLVIPTGTLTVGNSILSAAAAGGIGYGTGAGGSVVQGTGKNNAFALSKVTGKITLASGNVGADSTVSAAWTNTSIAATDVVVFSHVSGGTIGAYTFNAQCAAGSATFSIHNCTPGALNEANIVVEFVVLKSVIS